MKICWGNLEGFYLTRNGFLRKEDTTYVEMETCATCKESYLTVKSRPGMFCDCKCASNNIEFKERMFKLHSGKEHFINLIGQKFFRLTVIKKVGKSKNRNILWLCKCECGNECVVPSNHLKEGHTRSCGCYQRETVSNISGAKLIGKRFGRLKVIKESDKIVQRALVWECICDCGNIVKVHSAALSGGHTKSCGCLQWDLVWKGGISSEPYCDVWRDKEYAEFIKQRDGYKCLNPYCDSKNPNDLTRHHINYNKKDCRKENLIMACRSCNFKANYDREWHEAWYKAIMHMRYGYTY